MTDEFNEGEIYTNILDLTAKAGQILVMLTQIQPQCTVFEI